MIMDKVDRWCKLLGTTLVKVGVVDPQSGRTVKAQQSGKIQIDVIHGGVYDVKHGSSPYYISELLIGFGKAFGGFKDIDGKTSDRPGTSQIASAVSQSDTQLRTRQPAQFGELGSINRIYWSPDAHSIQDDSNREYKTKNPYGIIPAVAFFNSDPAHYYFLPINEPLIYANHALNMRMTDLNHIAKFQSFGVPVISGVERPKNVRMGRPVDDFNQLKGGSAQSRFGGVGGISGFGAGGQFRTFDAGLGIFRDGNADANALGFSIGPDTAIAVGEKGDFKFAHPNADINGLVKSMQSISDMVRINHGLRAKYTDSVPPSGFAHWMEKAGVIDENAGRRGKLFAEREAQLFQVIKQVWNTHNQQAGAKRFSEGAKLKVTYVAPKFPLDPKTAMEKTTMELKILETGDRQAYKELYPHFTDAEINKRIKQRRKDKEEQTIADTELEIKRINLLEEAGVAQVQDSATLSTKDIKTSKTSNVTMPPKDEAGDKADVAEPKIDNNLKHAQESSKQYKTENQVKKGSQS